MPAKGKHRRPKSLGLARSIAIVGAGGAVLALPLIGAAGAHAATPAAASATVKTYSVKAGDTLAKIARDQHLGGGWQKLYSDNRSVIGADPSALKPGLKLTLGAQAAAPKTATKAAASTGYGLPVQGAAIGTAYKTPGAMWSSGYHTGVDFVVPSGTPIKAIAAGTVVSAGLDGAYGNEVVIQHADGKYSQYAHMTSLSVSAGQTVTGGQQIGLSGATGNVTGPHLHFEIRTTPYYGSDVDPVAYLKQHGVSV
ncbi:LysM peptidoglycan-binding domain-containing protein [Streptomyces antnestii]|uniref:LysM peptidoglycan-binding domain-containing protein n=1 Tax=Streptomyces antnestii TaxID=2494256 RepID=A0A3S2WND1_9ACTN|nr:LysM peptidoglycan-binding domain-containing M23 family metallopeptidase [Streptomyces sp. San01]RVU28945.1 LysM peptidoglycan-binding domain-containing protein [Streptomyces sp. San01]